VSTEELVWGLSAGGCVVLGEACIINEGGCGGWGMRGVVSTATMVDLQTRLAISILTAIGDESPSGRR